MAGVKAGTPRKRDGKPAEKSGPPEWVPTDEDLAKVQALAGRGVPEKMIASLLGIDNKTLRKHCMVDLDKGRATGVANMAGKLYEAGMGGNFKAQALYLQHLAKWATRHVVEDEGLSALAQRLAAARERVRNRS